MADKRTKVQDPVVILPKQVQRSIDRALASLRTSQKAAA